MPVADNIAFAGIRAHFLVLRENVGDNTFVMEVVRVVEDVFSYQIMLRRKGSDARPVRWELPKADWLQLGNPTEVNLYFPTDKIMLLER
jgi:molybdate transport system ATP-binding protein